MVPKIGQNWFPELFVIGISYILKCTCDSLGQFVAYFFYTSTKTFCYSEMYVVQPINNFTIDGLTFLGVCIRVPESNDKFVSSFSFETTNK